MPAGSLPDSLLQQVLQSVQIIVQPVGPDQRLSSTKLQNVQEEADECEYWIELLLESGIVTGEEWKDVLHEADELTAIFTASLKTSRGVK